MKDALNKLSVPIVLMGSLWGAMGVVLEAFKVINERRDLAFKLIEDCGNCAERVLTPKIVYVTNMVPLTAGLVFFLIAVIALMIKIPKIVPLQDKVFERNIVLSSRLLAFPLIFVVVGFVLGGVFDFFYLVVDGRVQ